MTKTGRGRLFLESFVIVGSILLAFSIDAWWERAQEGERVQALAELLRVDLGREIADLEAQNARADTLLAAHDELSRIATTPALSLQRDSLASLVGRVWAASSFSPSLSAYEVARGSDAWDRLPPEVIAQLAEYLQGFTPFDTEIQIVAFSKLIDVAARYSGPEALLAGRAPERDYFGLIEDSEFLAWRWAHRTVMEGEQRWRTEQLVRLNRVVQALEEF